MTCKTMLNKIRELIYKISANLYDYCNDDNETILKEIQELTDRIERLKEELI